MKLEIENKEEKESKGKEKRVFLKPGRNNKEERENFIVYWANYIKTHSDKEWSRQQNVVIDSQYPELKD